MLWEGTRRTLYHLWDLKPGISDVTNIPLWMFQQQQRSVILINQYFLVFLGSLDNSGAGSPPENSQAQLCVLPAALGGDSGLAWLFLRVVRLRQRHQDPFQLCLNLPLPCL